MANMLEELLSKIAGAFTGGADPEAPRAPMGAPAVPQSAPNYAPTFGNRMKNFGLALQGHETPDLDKQAEAKNLTYQVLRAKGLDDATIKGAIANPEIMKQVLPEAFAPKMIKTAPGDVYFDRTGKRLFGNDMPKSDAIQQYEYYRNEESSAGRAPKSMEEWQKGLKAAGATAISIDQKGEASFAKEVGTQQAKRYNELVEGGLKAKQKRADLQILQDIGSNLQTGKTAEVMNALGPYAEALGIKIEGLPEMQAFDAIVNKLAPQMRAVGSGATSDFEMRGFLKSLPSLGKTPEGNALIQSTFEALHQTEIAASEIASRAMAGEISPKEAEKLLRDLPDPLEAFRRHNKTTARPAAAPAAQPADKGNSGKVRVWTKDGIR